MIGARSEPWVVNAKFNVMRDFLVIRCVNSVRNEFRKAPGVLRWYVVRVANACSVTVMTYQYYDSKVIFFYRFTVSFLKFGNFNNRLKVLLVICKQFCLPKRLPVCYKIDFQNQNTSRSRCFGDVIMPRVWRWGGHDYALENSPGATNYS